MYLNPTADHYGVSKVLIQILSRLPNERYKPIVILPQPGILEKDMAQFNVEYHIFPLTVIRRKEVSGLGLIRLLLMIVPNTLRLVWFLNQEKIDLVHTNGSVILDGAFAARILGISHIWHIHEMMQIESQFLWKLYEYLIVSLSNVIICISNGTAGQFSEHNKIRIIPNGTNINPSENLLEESSKSGKLRKIAKGRLSIGLIGRVSPRKGHEFLIECYASLINRRLDLDTILFIIGDIYPGYESYLQDLINKVKKEGLEDKVIFTGFCDDINSIYPQLDIIVVPSLLPEGFGLVIIEAMAARRPVIATALGGAKEIIEPEMSGLLVPPGDTKALEISLAYLIDHPEERERLGEAGYLRVLDRFEISKSLNLLFNTYQELLAI